MPYTIDVNTLTVDELDEVETLGELSASELFAGRVTSKALRALIYITERRTNPSFTLADAGQVRVADVQVQSEGGLPPADAAASEK